MRSVFILLISMLFSITCKAQSVEHHVIGSAGAELLNGNGELYFTVGEPVSETFENENFQLTQGYHQGVFLFVSTESLTDSSFDIKVFPNPASEFVNISLDNISSINFEYRLYDLNGRVIISGKFSNSTEQISLTQLANSSYFLKIYNSKAGYDVTYQLQKSH